MKAIEYGEYQPGAVELSIADSVTDQSPTCSNICHGLSWSFRDAVTHTLKSYVIPCPGKYTGAEVGQALSFDISNKNTAQTDHFGLMGSNN